MKSNLPQVTNAEASQQLAIKARAALLKGASQDWTEAKAKATEAGKLELQSLNLLRTAGVKLQEACDRDNLCFASFEKMQSALPKDLTFPAAKFCVSLCKTFDKPIASLEEAAAARRILFQKLNQEEEPKRLEQQTAHERNTWSELITKAMGFTAFFDELQEEEPMEKWGKDKLRSFISTTKPIADRHAEAVKLVGK